MGTFACVGTGSCVIERAATDDHGFPSCDMDPDMAGFQRDGQANWEFTPDPGAMVTVPDQDWMVFGAWLTTPDGGTGEHSSACSTPVWMSMGTAMTAAA